MNKKAELTTQQIVTLIILIISFAVILFLLVRLQLGESTDKEICHNSVVLKARSSGIQGNLDCKTNYVCISGGEKCENFNAKITKEVNPTNSDEIFKAIAEEMADCWWMFAEGELDYTTSEWGYPCAICSIIKFDSTIQEKFPKIKYSELNNFLSRTMKTEYQSYLQYIYGTDDFEKFKPSAIKEKININFEDPLNTKDKFTIITGRDDADTYFHTYFIKSDDTPKSKGITPCTEFVTKS